MSTWIEIKEEDISFDENDVNFSIEHPAVDDTNGNVYVCVNKELLIKLIKNVQSN